MKRKKEWKIRGESEKRGSFLETGNEHSEFVEMTGRVYLRDPFFLFTKNLLKSRERTIGILLEINFGAKIRGWISNMD